MGVRLVGQGALDGVEWLVPAHSVRYAVEREKALAMDARHMRIDQRDDVARMIHRRPCHIHRRPQRTVPMRIGWRDLKKGDIERQSAIGGKERWDIGQEDRSVTG